MHVCILRTDSLNSFVFCVVFSSPLNAVLFMYFQIYIKPDWNIIRFLPYITEYCRNKILSTSSTQQNQLWYYSYLENAQRISRIYRDQPLTPLQQAVFWTEYVIRHKGAPHMRSAALDLAWYQYFLLDVIAVLALAVGSVVLIVFIILRGLLRRFWFAKNNYKERKKRDWRCIHVN